MRVEELKRYLEDNDEWAWKPDEKAPDEAILIGNSRVDTATRATFEAIKKNDLPTILGACVQGKDVTQITRVTGYFSKVAGWNKGKVGELHDRHRSVI